MKKKNALFILHYAPPIHGAAKVGDTILKSKLLNETFSCRFIKINSSDKIEDIGAFNFFKIISSIELFFKTVYQIITFQPQIIYFTVSPRGFAFYRDFIISIPIKVYNLFNKSRLSVFYHYHARGILEFTNASSVSKKLTNFFLRNVNVILLSDLIKNDLKFVSSYKKIIVLNNGVENSLSKEDFGKMLSDRTNKKNIDILYLSNMIKDKGYDKVLEIASKSRLSKSTSKYSFHFAGAWSSDAEKSYFYNYVEENNLEDMVTYHGLVTGEKKSELFKKTNVFFFPTRYKREVFPLSVLEALSYGLPVLTFNQGAISDIINTSIGIISSEKNLYEDFNKITEDYLTLTTYQQCREFFLDNFSEQKFLLNLISILNNKTF